MDITEIPTLIKSFQEHLAGMESRVAALEAAAKAAALSAQSSRDGAGDTRAADGHAADEANHADLQARLREMEQSLQEANRNWQEWYSACEAEKKKAEAAAEKLEAAEKKNAAFLAAEEEARKENEALTVRLRSAELEQAALLKKLEESKASASDNDVLLKRFWPACLNADTLQPFQTQWREELGKQGASPSLLCMFANIFSWSCYHELQKSKSSTDTELDRPEYTALHSFSRYFMDWLYETGRNSDEVADISRELAIYINDLLEKDNAKYTIEVDEVDLGDTFSAALMQAVPYGNSTGHVKQLHSWAIVPSTGSGICLAKAMVLL